LYHRICSAPASVVVQQKASARPHRAAHVALGIDQVIQVSYDHDFLPLHLRAMITPNNRLPEREKTVFTAWLY
jgi:hypothetical protein